MNAKPPAAHEARARRRVCVCVVWEGVRSVARRIVTRASRPRPTNDTTRRPIEHNGSCEKNHGPLASSLLSAPRPRPRSLETWTCAQARDGCSCDTPQDEESAPCSSSEDERAAAKRRRTAARPPSTWACCTDCNAWRRLSRHAIAPAVNEVHGRRRADDDARARGALCERTRHSNEPASPGIPSLRESRTHIPRATPPRGVVAARASHARRFRLARGGFEAWNCSQARFRCSCATPPDELSSDESTAVAANHHSARAVEQASALVFARPPCSTAPVLFFFSRPPWRCRRITSGRAA